MANREPLTDENGDVRELAEEELSQFRPGQEVLPEAMQKAMGIHPSQQSGRTARSSPKGTVVARAKRAGQKSTVVWRPRVTKLGNKPRILSLHKILKTGTPKPRKTRRK
ncbi:hypothetical protein [Aquisalimonas sp.]|uniref:hypothetical protein n=1 Tax=Aquisalimonas sp. TaxID=1872621 RepID=UPI0025B90DBB|nr:hypothetical protein [Aquisalimonas sp.]